MLNVYEQIQNTKSFMISFTSSPGVLQKLTCSLKFIDNNGIVITASKSQNENIIAKSGNEINVCVYNELGIFTAVSKIIKVIKGSMSVEYMISHLEKSKHLQRREYFREEMAIDSSVTILTENADSNNYIIYTKTKNICGNGMSFISDYSLPDFASIIAEIYFKEKRVITLAVPIHCRKVKLCNKIKWIHGLQFIDIPQKDTDFIVKKCFLHQLELRRKHAT